MLDVFDRLPRGVVPRGKEGDLGFDIQLEALAVDKARVNGSVKGDAVIVWPVAKEAWVSGHAKGAGLPVVDWRQRLQLY